MTPRLYARTRTLPAQPDLHQLKRQAKELLKAFAAGDAAAVAEVNAHYQGALAESFALHDAQLVLARSYGFPSWPKMKAYVDGITVGRLVDAIRAGDLKTVRSMVRVRPELVQLDVAEHDEHRALHHAVLQRRPEIVRFLMQHGADPRKGIYPYRDATGAFTLAVERGYTDIVEIMRVEEHRRTSKSPLAVVDEEVLEEMNAVLRRDDEDAMIAVIASLSRSPCSTPVADWTFATTCSRALRSDGPAAGGVSSWCDCFWREAPIRSRPTPSLGRRRGHGRRK